MDILNIFFWDFWNILWVLGCCFIIGFLFFIFVVVFCVIVGGRFEIVVGELFFILGLFSDWEVFWIEFWIGVFVIIVFLNFNNIVNMYKEDRIVWVWVYKFKY